MFQSLSRLLWSTWKCVLCYLKSTFSFQSKYFYTEIDSHHRLKCLMHGDVNVGEHWGHCSKEVVKKTAVLSSTHPKQTSAPIKSRNKMTLLFLPTQIVKQLEITSATPTAVTCITIIHHHICTRDWLIYRHIDEPIDWLIGANRGIWM